MYEIFSLLQLWWIDEVLEEHLRTRIHHLQIILVWPWLDSFAGVRLNGLVLLYYLRRQLLLHGILHHRQFCCLLRYLFGNVDPDRLILIIVNYTRRIGSMYLRIAIWCLLRLLTDLVNERLPCESIGFKVPFHRFMYLYLTIEALSNSTKPLRWQLLLPMHLVLLVRKVLLRLHRHRTSLYLLQLLHTLPSHELLLLLRKYFVQRFSSNARQRGAISLLFKLRRCFSLRLVFLINVQITAEICGRYLLRLV